MNLPINFIFCICNLSKVVINLLFDDKKDDPTANAGRGSNLTEDGHVECDASIMDGDSGAFGAVGAVPGTMLHPSFFSHCWACGCVLLNGDLTMLFGFLVTIWCNYIIDLLISRSGVRNAIQIASLLAKEQMTGSSLLGLISPM